MRIVDGDLLHMFCQIRQIAGGGGGGGFLLYCVMSTINTG